MKPLLLALPLLALLLANSACNLIPEPKADPTHYYALTLPAGLESTIPSAKTALRIGLKPIELAPYLRKGVIVVREGENEISYNDYARWAEPLDQSIVRFLQICLAADPKISIASIPPLSANEERDYDVSIKLRRADGVRTKGVKGYTGTVRFVAVIEIYSVGAVPALVATKAFVAPEHSWDGTNHSALVQALSTDLHALAKEVVDLLPDPKK